MRKRLQLRVTYSDKSDWKNYCLLLLTTMLLVITSCKDDELYSYPPDHLVLGQSITITTGRNVNDQNNAQSDFAFPWLEGDQIGVTNSKTSNTPFSINKGMDSKSGDFVGALYATTASEHIYSVFPYNIGKKFKLAGDALEYTFDLQEKQLSDDIAQNLYMYGKTDAALDIATGITSMNMSDLMTIIDFEITNIPVGTEISAVVINSENMFTKSATVTFPFEPTAIPSIEASSSKANRIDVQLTDDLRKGIIVSNGTLSVPLAMFSQTIAKDKEWNVDVMAVVKTNVYPVQLGETYQMNFTAEKTFVAGTRYKENIVLEAEETYDVVTLTVNVGPGATLDAALGENKHLVTDLVVTGTLAKEDQLLFRTLQAIRNLDIQDVTNTSLESYILNGALQSPETQAPPAPKILRSIKLPKGLSPNAPWYGFEDCIKLKSIEIPSGVTSITNECFQNCTSLSTAILSDGLISIGNWGFSNTKITAIIFPKTMTALNNGAFHSCKSLTEVTFLGETPPVTIHSAVFTYAPIQVIFVPNASVEAYKAHPGLKELKGVIVPESDRPVKQ